MGLGEGACYREGKRYEREERDKKKCFGVSPPDSLSIFHPLCGTFVQLLAFLTNAKKAVL